MTVNEYLSRLVDLTYQVFFEFPISSLTVPRATARLTSGEMKDTYDDLKPISEQLYELCTSTESVSAVLARDPTLTPEQAWKKLYGKYEGKHAAKKLLHGEAPSLTAEQVLAQTAECGKWGPTRPSELFLRLYHDALCSLDESGVDAAMVSPSLVGSCGTVPLTVISTVPDIVRHMSNCIVRAEREVYLATNYWQNGVASKFLTDAIRELSRRAGEKGTKIVMKIIYDRGSPKQVFEPHYLVSEKAYTGKAVNLPHPSEIPNIDMEVVNYHQPMLGTFHAKYMVVDRKIAILQSNNIQDNDNVEMMVHLEGPIVDSMYDMALISWHMRMSPPLPTLDTPAAQAGGNPSETLNDDVGRIPTGHGSSESGQDRTLDSVSNVPIANEALAGFLSVGESPVPQPPSENTIPEHTADTPHYDATLVDEVRRVQASLTSPSPLEAINRKLNHTTNPGFPATSPPPSHGSEMTPYILSPPHGPIPMALVNRPPHGAPNNKSLHNPQNAVWLAALQHATRNVFIQSPTLNAEPLVPAIAAACERGVDVFCYISIGYNDAGELLPMQGGHNEMIAHNLYTSLSPAGRAHLHYYWYVGKDQTKPIIQAKKKRSCHIKLMIVDEHIGITGNGNQDTQSWFHSQEINVMIDSREICKAWIEGLRRNQNTHLYGELDKETGVWRDAEGREADGAMGVDPGRFSWAKGIVGAVKRVQGTGGF